MLLKKWMVILFSVVTILMNSRLDSSQLRWRSRVHPDLARQISLQIQMMRTAPTFVNQRVLALQAMLQARHEQMPLPVKLEIKSTSVPRIVSQQSGVSCTKSLASVESAVALGTIEDCNRVIRQIEQDILSVDTMSDAELREFQEYLEKIIAWIDTHIYQLEQIKDRDALNSTYVKKLEEVCSLCCKVYDDIDARLKQTAPEGLTQEAAKPVVQQSDLMLADAPAELRTIEDCDKVIQKLEQDALRLDAMSDPELREYQEHLKNMGISADEFICTLEQKGAEALHILDSPYGKKLEEVCTVCSKHYGAVHIVVWQRFERQCVNSSLEGLVDILGHELKSQKELSTKLSETGSSDEHVQINEELKISRDKTELCSNLIQSRIERLTENIGGQSYEELSDNRKVLLNVIMQFKEQGLSGCSLQHSALLALEKVQSAIDSKVEDHDVKPSWKKNEFYEQAERTPLEDLYAYQLAYTSESYEFQTIYSVCRSRKYDFYSKLAKLNNEELKDFAARLHASRYKDPDVKLSEKQLIMRNEMLKRMEYEVRDQVSESRKYKLAVKDKQRYERQQAIEDAWPLILQLQVTTRTMPALGIDWPVQRTATTQQVVFPATQATYRQPMRLTPAQISVITKIEAQRHVVMAARNSLMLQKGILIDLKTQYSSTKITAHKEALAQKVAYLQDRVDRLAHTFNAELDVYRSILYAAKHDCRDVESLINLVHVLSSQREDIQDIPELVAIHNQIGAAICDHITQDVIQSGDLAKLGEHMRVLLKIRTKIKEQDHNQEALKICDDTLKLIAISLGNRLESIIRKQPNFLKDWPLLAAFGFNKKETLWHNIVQGFTLLHNTIKNLAIPGARPVKSILADLYKAQLILQKARHDLEGLAPAGLDLVGIDKNEYHQIHQEVIDELHEIDWLIGCLKDCGVHSAAQLIQVINTPEFLSSKLAEEWRTYEPLREFIAGHYREDMSVDAIITACANANICRIMQPQEYQEYMVQNLFEAHNCLMEKFVHLCQLQAHIKNRGDRGLDPDYCDEYSRATCELKDIGLCVAKMLATLNPNGVYGNGFKSFDMVLEEQAREKRLSAQDRDIITQILEFYAQVLIQKYAWIGISTDFERTVRGFAGPFGFNLVRWHTPEEIHLDIQRHALDTHKKKIEDKSQAAASRQTDPNPAIDINRKALSFLIARLEASKRQLDACDQAPAGTPSVTTQLSRNAEEFIRLAHTSPQELIRLEATNPEKFGQLMAAVSADALTLRVNPDSADLVRLNNAAWQYRQEKFKILREQCDVLAQGQYNPLLMLDALETSTGLVMFDEQSRQDGDPQAQLRSMMVLKMLNQTPLQEFLHAQPAREYTLPPITPDASFQDLIARQNYLQASGIMDRLDGEAAAACAKLLIHDGPHVIKGTAKGAAKAFNPVNLARGAYAMAKQTSAAAGFVLLQAARLETAQELAAKHPEQAQAILKQYNAANAAVVEGAIQIGRDFATHMSTMSRKERIEFIAETLAEFALTKSSTKFWFAATGKALNVAGKGVRKIAQVVEEVNPGKPKAIAATPEGVMLDVAEVVETEANPLAEVAKLQEGPAVEGKAAAQGVQVAEDAEALTAKPKALKNPEQVVAQQNRHIHGARLKIEKLQNYFRQKIACVENPEFESANLEHLFGADKLVKERAGGAIDAKYSGLHHDKGWKLVKKGKIEFLSERKIDPRTGAIKVERLTIEGKLIKDKTFFPAEWSRRKVIDKIIEASKNIVETVDIGITCDQIVGITEEGMKILLVIRRADKFLITAYPYMKGF